MGSCPICGGFAMHRICAPCKCKAEKNAAATERNINQPIGALRARGEEMGVVRKGCFCEICSKQLTLTNGKEHVCHECYNRANAESQKDTADLRQLHRDAALAVLAGMPRVGMESNITIGALVAEALLYADEFVRQYNPDAVIAEVVG